MGYPMTYSRLIHRNGLVDGTYGSTGTTVNIAALPEWAQQPVALMAGRFGAICGDLRRLEKDALDEHAICDHIADKTGIDRDTVAGVLREFFAW
jgi:hypothetical protein